MSVVMTAERQLSHAQALLARGAALPPDGMPQPEILDSWVRCMQAGLDAALRIAPPVVEAADLARRRERWASARRMAQVELETLAQQIAGSNFLLAYADPEGVILDLYHDNRFTMSQDGAGIVAGSCWSEAVAGTNGLGTALAEGRSVAVTGLEHYYLQLGQISCTAAPVRDAAGEVVGVLDASSFFDSRQRHTQALVQMAATQIENRLLVQQLRTHWVLAFHPRAEYLGTLSAGLVAFSEAGRLLAMNARGKQMLQGLTAQPGASFDELFDEPFDLAAARLARQSEIRLRDSMGSAYSVLCINRPPRPPAQKPSVEAAPALMTKGAPAEPRLAAGTPQRVARTLIAPPERVPQGRRGIAVKLSQIGAEGSAEAAGLADPAVAAAYAMADRAARLGVPVLIHGETGTGKEWLARHVHQASGRLGAFVAVNCGAIPAELFEAELFGYAGGAYTGARREGSAGLIASADGGTLLLDEIRELPAGLQAGLLRFLDDQQVRAVGSTQARRVNVQLVAATHADLEAEVAAKAFRADLMYRLNTVRLTLPALRDRQDFARCVHVVLHELDPAARIDAAAIESLAQHRWPGNFRELRAVLARTLLTLNGGSIGAEAVQAYLPAAAAAAAAAGPVIAGGDLRQRSSHMVQRELQRQGGSISDTARVLGISRTTVYRHLREGVAGA